MVGSQEMRPAGAPVSPSPSSLYLLPLVPRRMPGERSPKARLVTSHAPVSCQQAETHLRRGYGTALQTATQPRAGALTLPFAHMGLPLSRRTALSMPTHLLLGVDKSPPQAHTDGSYSRGCESKHPINLHTPCFPKGLCPPPGLAGTSFPYHCHTGRAANMPGI